jgi:hypothetical protein
VLELLPCYRPEDGRARLLGNQRVAGIAVFWNYLAISAHVLAIVATETSTEIKMADVVGMGLPIHFHFRKCCSLINSLHFIDRVANV